MKTLFKTFGTRGQLSYLLYSKQGVIKIKTQQVHVHSYQ